MFVTVFDDVGVVAVVAVQKTSETRDVRIQSTVAVVAPLDPAGRRVVALTCNLITAG